MNPWAEPFEKKFFLNILSKLQYSSKFFSNNCVGHGFYPLGKSPPLRGGEKTE